MPAAKNLLLLLVNIYRYSISPFLGRSCRFHPSCSLYAQEALQKYGATKGCCLTLKRISRCHPWSRGGYDPVP